jgi:uncharacterized protein YegP (UPF0339 family)
MKFEIYKDAQKLWRWKLVAANGEILASGEGYTRKRTCMAAIALVQSSASAEVQMV